MHIYMYQEMYFLIVVCVQGNCPLSPGRVKHTRLATSRVTHMNAISNTICEKEENF